MLHQAHIFLTDSFDDSPVFNLYFPLSFLSSFYNLAINSSLLIIPFTTSNSTNAPLSSTLEMAHSWMETFFCYVILPLFDSFDLRNVPPTYVALPSILMRRLPRARHSKAFTGSVLSKKRWPTAPLKLAIAPRYNECTASCSAVTLLKAKRGA